GLPFAEGFVKTVAAAAGGAVVVQMLKEPIASWVNMDTGFGVLLQGAGAGLGGMVVYYLLARYFKCPGVPSMHAMNLFLRQRMGVRGLSLSSQGRASGITNKE
ncbi:MAG: hypothetical protein UY82_C0065G0008, partial [Candidatus Uhrbacteria bacterium GW2011_GWC2_53_7]